jgi:transposase
MFGKNYIANMQELKEPLISQDHEEQLNYNFLNSYKAELDESKKKRVRKPLDENEDEASQDPSGR